MAKDLNEVIMIGRLVRDIEVKIYGETTIGNFSIAVNNIKKIDNEYIDEVSFFDCVIFGKLVISLQRFLTKGKQIAIKGYAKQERWQDKQTGQNRYAIKFICEQIQLLGNNAATAIKETEEAFNETDFDSNTEF